MQFNIAKIAKKKQNVCLAEVEKMVIVWSVIVMWVI